MQYQSRSEYVICPCASGFKDKMATTWTLNLWAPSNHNKTRRARQAELHSLYLWQVGQSRLRNKVLSFFHSRHSLQDLARSFFTEWQCNAKWGVHKSQVQENKNPAFNGNHKQGIGNKSMQNGQYAPTSSYDAHKAWPLTIDKCMGCGGGYRVTKQKGTLSQCHIVNQ